MINVAVKTEFPNEIFPAIHDGIVRAIDKISSIAQQVAKEHVQKDTGLLFNSLHLIRRHNPPNYNGGLQTNLGYAVVMNDGREPGGRFPPALPIERWIIRHKGTFAEALRKLQPKTTRGKLSPKQRALKSLTFLVQRKIADKGTDGSQFFNKAEAAAIKALTPQMDALGIQIEKAWEGG